MTTPTNSGIKELYEAVLLLKTEEECRKFFRDLLTEAETKEFANRWKVACMLNQKVSYKQIEKQTGMSSTTIARISKWLQKGAGGYQLLLNKLELRTKPKNYGVHHTASRGGVIFSG